MNSELFIPQDMVMRRRRRLRILVAAISALLIACTNVAIAQADQWNGYGNQFNYRMTGNNNVNYYYDSTIVGSTYAEAMDSAILS